MFAAGYAETGTEDGLAAQHRLAAIAASGGMHLVGPNCVGIASHDRRLRAAFAEFGALSARSTSASGPDCDVQARTEAVRLRIALVSQSGALALALSQAADRGVDLTHVLTCGNSADVDVADYLVSLAEDSACDAIALVFEGLRDPTRLESALDHAVLAGKRVAMRHIGRSMAGLEAIRFHTATSSPACLAAHPARRGIVSVTPIEAVIETSVFLAKAPAAPAKPLGAGVAVLSSSGGTGILAADAAERAGVALPQPGELTLERLRSTLPAFAAARNPCDTTAQATRHPDLLADAAEALLGDARYSALVLPWGQSQSAALLPRLGALGRAHGKPICIVWTGANLIPERVVAIERNPALALFRSLDACFTALAGWLRG